MVGMTDHDSVSATVNSVLETLENLPASTHSSAAAQAYSSRLFNRQRSVHEILGGGKTADAFLWRKRNTTVGLLATVSVAYFLFQWSGYTLLSIVSNVLLFLIVILFLWANAASMLNRPPPSIPELELSEDIVYQSADTLRVEINKALVLAHDVAIGKDFRVFLKMVVILWVLSTIGGWFSFLTFVYIGFVAAHTLPVLYEKYENEIEKYLQILIKEAKKYYVKFDELVLSKIPRVGQKQKKLQ
ncbi:hypothetical protein O6H91_01G030900 [Diphasiastrum complanatum]|uniref:Uncharacterized protein n=1 Tax=Diphasiastrum complanatum TaxID=34168 RepID=A0ACC2EPI0_DIPCM|nr:hypothetical protein O6H91_01G030900 [Diphasiastrum complanatum]